MGMLTWSIQRIPEGKSDNTKINSNKMKEYADHWTSPSFNFKLTVIIYPR